MTSILNKKYQVNEKISSEKINSIYGKNFSFLLANLLFARGIYKKEDIEKFLNPKWEQTHNPFLFNDMDKIVERIFNAVRTNEKILIFSDYDTDGIPGGALFYKFFEKIGYENFQNYIPNRNKDGYGLSNKKAQKIVDGKIFENSKFGNFSEKLKAGSENFLPTLVITIDCGITDIEAGKILAREKIDLIITDHHLPKKELPKSFGILNHKIIGENYPDKNLCGCGIIFKLVQALLVKNIEEKLWEIPEGWEKWLLDLVSISTVCDMVPLLGENRIFVKFGKLVFAKTQNTGLKKIIEKSRIDKNNISADDLGFMIGPRINSASRLCDPFIAFTALSKNSQEGIECAENLEKLNNRRKYLTAKIMKEVWKKLDERKILNVIVIGNKDWPLGILGLIAGKISDKYKVPAFVWAQADGETENKLKGSCRSGGKFSVFSLMNNNQKEFLHFGGHSASGGFEIEENKIHFLEKKLSENLESADLIEEKKVILDSEIFLDDVNHKNYSDIEKLEPFGMNNQKPIFLLKNIEIFSIRIFGKEQNHLELNFKNSRGMIIKAITFYFSDTLKNSDFEVGQKINLIASFQINSWNGNKNLQLKIEDII